MTRRDEIFEFICDYADEHVGNSPTLHELAGIFRVEGRLLSYSTVRYHVTLLIAEGRLVRVDGKLVVIRAEWERPQRIVGLSDSFM